jgi:hypothetical protein
MAEFEAESGGRKVTVRIWRSLLGSGREIDQSEAGPWARKGNGRVGGGILGAEGHRRDLEVIWWPEGGGPIRRSVDGTYILTGKVDGRFRVRSWTER